MIFDFLEDEIVGRTALKKSSALKSSMIEHSSTAKRLTDKPRAELADVADILILLPLANLIVWPCHTVTAGFKNAGISSYASLILCRISSEVSSLLEMIRTVLSSLNITYHRIMIVRSVVFPCWRELTTQTLLFSAMSFNSFFCTG